METCPNDLERERFLAGEVSGETRVALERHLEGCPDCDGWLERAQADEDLLGPLRQAWQETSHEDATDLGVAAGESPEGLGRYRIGPLLGSGGMGAVFEAEQQNPRRKVALKVVRPGLSSEQLLRRFEFEAEVLSRLDHPGIARIYEAGTFGLGDQRRPFFSMELVRGRSLMDFVEDQQTNLRDRLGLFCRICSAVEHAHQKGVVHRDLKPSNVLVSETGEPKILDFGVARVIGGDLKSATLHTDVGQIVGTLAYMSPEQVGADSSAVDVRSDVYSLGVLFHELLTGERPYDVTGRPITEAVRIIREEPPRPLGASSSSLSGDLQTIAAKALEKEPARRYASAGELAADVTRFLNHEPIAARPPSTLYQLLCFSQRHRALVGGGVAVFLAVLAGLVVNLVLKQEARQERNNVLRLSAFRELKELEDRADALWPIHPDLIPDMEGWLEDARGFVAGLHPNRAEGDPGHYAQREQIRARALPSDPAVLAQLEEDWRDEIEMLRREITARNREQEVRAGRAEPLVSEVKAKDLTLDVERLTKQAKHLVNPKRTDFGREAEGRALARLAVERAVQPLEKMRAHWALAWACYSLGLDEPALEAAREALAAAPDDMLESEYLRWLSEEVHYWRNWRYSEMILGRERDLVALEARIISVPEYLFEDVRDEWWHDQIEELVTAIEGFDDHRRGLSRGVSERFGWGVERRLALARTIAERSIAGPEVAGLWRTAIASIAEREQCPAYDGLVIEPQVGLVPLGRDPDSGLWEFWHVSSGDRPERDSEGHCIAGIETGVVLVLIPGGTFLMGAQSSDLEGPNYDPAALADEGPVHQVTLSPYFISKFELTQGQWERLSGGNRSRRNPEVYMTPILSRLSLPVDTLTWLECDTTFGRFGLQLPTEAQWEYAARAGTSTRWWVGDDSRALATAANLADATCRNEIGAVSWVFEEWDDGFAEPAPVGSLDANAFGLHDVVGNLWELCADTYGRHAYKSGRPVDPSFTQTSSRSRTARGGAYNDPAAAGRSAIRNSAEIVYEGATMGVRPGRSLNR